MNLTRIAELTLEAAALSNAAHHPNPLADFARHAREGKAHIEWATAYGKPYVESHLVRPARGMATAGQSEYYTRWATAPWFKPRAVEIARELAAIVGTY